MTHKTLVGGTAYNITGGKSLVSGTTYSIKGGRTLVWGTGYNISFGEEPTAMLYSDGSFVFQEGDEVESGKTLTASYTGFEDINTSPPWNGKQNTFNSVSFNTEIAPKSMYYWFYNAGNMKAYINSFTNLNINNVTSMFRTYYYCSNLTGSPVCGNNVIDMSYAYYYCRNLTGSPVCGSNVTNISYTYCYCSNLTGSPVCGDKVTNMFYAYRNCYNLTGSPVCGNNVTNMYGAYFECKNLASNAYFYSSSISNIAQCFSNWPRTKYLNLYLPANSTSLTTALYNNTSSMVGTTITWTNDTANNRYYNTYYNIYIYPVANVAAARAANGD